MGQISAFRDYILNTSFHGFRYTAENGRHWSERIFWTICCILSWIATGLLIKSSWDDFQNNSISFVVDTSYLNWDTHFPSIAVCESDNQKRIAEVTDRTYGDPHDYNLDEIVKELVYFRGLSFYTLQICGPEAPIPNENCFRKNFTEFSEEVRSNCAQIFRHCKWNNVTFDCCKYFGEINSEMGVCYAINSIQVGHATPKLSMISNKKAGPGRLYLEMNGHTNVYILGEQEVPTLTTLTTDVLQVTPHIHYQRFFAIKEIENQPEVAEVSVKQRKCRFTYESHLDVYPFYSYSSCCVQCRKNAQIRTCNCVHHLMPNTPQKIHCNITGLYCLSKHYNELSILKPFWATRTGLVCNCLPSCTEIELSVIKDNKIGISEDYAIVELALERLPTERYKRNVVRGKLDLVVSMGGSTALFLGASILQHTSEEGSVMRFATGECLLQRLRLLFNINATNTEVPFNRFITQILQFYRVYGHIMAYNRMHQGNFIPLTGFNRSFLCQFASLTSLFNLETSISHGKCMESTVGEPVTKLPFYKALPPANCTTSSSTDTE